MTLVLSLLEQNVCVCDGRVLCVNLKVTAPLKPQRLILRRSVEFPQGPRQERRVTSLVLEKGGQFQDLFYSARPRLYTLTHTWLCKPSPGAPGNLTNFTLSRKQSRTDLDRGLLVT